MSDLVRVKKMLKSIVDGIPLEHLETKSIYELQDMLKAIRKTVKLAHKECKRIEWYEGQAALEQTQDVNSTEPTEKEEVEVEKIEIEVKEWFSKKEGIPARFEANVLTKSDRAVRTKEHGWIPKSQIVSEKKVS